MAKWTEEMRKAASEKMKAQWKNGSLKGRKKQRAPKVQIRGRKATPKVVIKKRARRPSMTLETMLLRVLNAHIRNEVKSVLKESIHL